MPLWLFRVLDRALDAVFGIMGFISFCLEGVLETFTDRWKFVRSLMFFVLGAVVCHLLHRFLGR